VRIVGREAESAIDALLELLRQDVLEPVCLVVHIVHVQSQSLREVQLEQPVVANHLERDLLAGIRERHAAVRRVLEQPERGELLHHRARRRGRDTLSLRERGDRRPVAFVLELVDLLEVVLDRVGQRNLRHSKSVGVAHRANRVDTLARVLIRLGHSPDPDDAFMFWAISAGKIDTRGFEFEQVAQDIGTLNEWALDGRLDVTAISLHTYPRVQDRYVLLPHGASMGSGYGPVVVSREPVSVEELRELEVAVPGRSTTAFLVLKMVMGGEFRCRELPFDAIIDEVKSGRADAGLVIHEGQLTYESEGLQKVLDLGEWWLLETGLPLPLGVNVARRELGEDTLRELSKVLRESITAGLANRQEARRYALRFARGIDDALADRFIEMYVNELTCDYGDEGRQAVQELLSRAEAVGAYERPVRLEFVA
jgi:1,4-dihydroxy-6-naphthoate synthase